MKQTLISRLDIVNTTSIKGNVSEQVLCPHIDLELIFSSTLGLPMLSTIMGSIKNYEGVEEYDEESDYNINDMASYKGVIYKKVSDNEDEDGTVVDPSCSDDWETVPMFDNECLNSLWPYLKKWLCWAVAYNAAPFIHVEYGADGFSVQTDSSQGSVNAGNELYSQTVESYRKRKYMYYNLLNSKIVELYKSEECNIFDSLKIVTDCCDTKSKRGQQNESSTGLHFHYDDEYEY